MYRSINGYKDNMDISKVKKYVYLICLFFAIAVLIEDFVFNFKFFTNIFNKPYRAELIYDDGYAVNEDGTVLVLDGEHCIYVPNVNDRLKTIKLDIYDINQEKTEVYTYFGATDYSHAYDTHLGSRTIYSGVERSKYISFHLYGDCKTLRITPMVNKDQILKVEVIVNSKVPIFFEIDRVMFVFLIICVLYFLRPNSVLHSIKYVEWKGKSRILFWIIYTIANVSLFFWMVKLNPYYQYETGSNFAQYQELTEGFLMGKLHVLEEPPQELIDMDNPYDMDARVNVCEDAGVNYLFDHAYYNGHYYVYFGVVPVILIYLPYYMLVGKHIHNYVVILIGMLFLFAAIVLVLDAIIRRYSRKCSIAIWFLLTEFVIMGNYMLYILKRPDFYSIPNTYGLAFGMWGMYFFLKAFDDPYNAEATGRTIIKYKYVFAGSLCTALICGCRPQLFMFVLLDIIILRKKIFKVSLLKNKDGMLVWANILIPMVIVASGLMVYNAARFGSPFDFGANYNLTFNDMRFRGWNFDRIPLGIFMYLLHPMNVSTEYPYFANVFVESKYMGVTIQETTYGGVLMAFPFAWIGLIPIFLHKKFNKNSTLWMITVASWIITIIVVIVDTEMSGILARYFADFSIFTVIAAVTATLLIVSRKDVKGTYLYNVFVIFLLVCFVFECFYHINVFMLDSGDYLRNNRKDLFYHIYYLVSFAI